jgi:DNA (cytosine-5)-methyltransferase 1
VFVVGCLGDWRSAAKVLFEPESLCRNITPSRGERKEIANCLTKSPSSYSSYNPARSEGNAVVWPAQLASTLNASFGSKMGLENQHINSGAPLFIPVHARDGEEVLGTLTASYGTGGADLETKPLVHNIAFTTEQTPKASIDLAHTLTSSNYKHNQCVAYNITFCDANGTRKDRPNGGLYVNETDTSNTLTKAGVGTNAVQNMRVRRLTPVECERLQGFPDNYTNTPTSSDATRYKALGNSMAVPVMKWIGNRIMEIES